MKITKRQLKRIITNSLVNEAAFEIEVGIPQDTDSIGNPPRVSMWYREEDGEVDASVQDSDGDAVGSMLANASGKDSKDSISANSLEDNESDILGGLRIGLEDADSLDTKNKITQAIARLLGDDEEMIQKNMADYLANRHLAASAQALKAKHKFVK